MEPHLAAELAQARKEIEHLRQRLDALERNGAARSLPETALLDHSFLKRAFAVLGHYLVAGLIIAIPFYILIFLLMVAIGGF